MSKTWFCHTKILYFCWFSNKLDESVHRLPYWQFTISAWHSHNILLHISTQHISLILGQPNSIFVYSRRLIRCSTYMYLVCHSVYKISFTFHSLLLVENLSLQTCYSVKGALFDFSKFSSLFHSKSHHSKDVNLKFRLKQPSHLRYEVIMCIAVPISYSVRLIMVSGVTGRGQGAGGRVSPETSDWEIFASYWEKREGKKGKGVKIEKKRRTIVKGKVEIGNGSRKSYKKKL